MARRRDWKARKYALKIAANPCRRTETVARLRRDISLHWRIRSEWGLWKDLRVVGGKCAPANAFAIHLANKCTLFLASMSIDDHHERLLQSNRAAR